MNMYFEMAESMVHHFKHKYLVKHDAHKKVHYIRLSYAAERIWVEDETGVIFIKHRYLPIETKVDMAEFMWVKLRSQSVYDKA